MYAILEEAILKCWLKGVFLETKQANQMSFCFFKLIIDRKWRQFETLLIIYYQVNTVINKKGEQVLTK